MGKLIYGSPGTEIDFDDRVLTHLQIVMVSKLRRDESFVFSWREEQATGDGRSTLWLHPSIPLHFRFYGSRVPAINREWIDRLSAAANSSGGLRIVDEPPAEG